MNTLSATSLLTHSLAWALLHTLWQGLAVYGVLFVVLKALRHVSSQVKYVLSVSAFAVLFIWFADTWAAQYQKLKGTTVYITQGIGNALPQAAHPSAAATVSYNSYSLLARSVGALEQSSSLILVLYCIGLTLMVFRFAVNIWQVGQLRRSGIVAPHAHLQELVVQWQEQFSISRPVKLLLSDRVDVPMMLGILKPVILLPVATINHLSIDQLEAILIHELAHIKRQDYLLNILQTLAETMLFFNPFVWLISAIIRREREHCCDDIVVAQTADPMPYARALAILGTNRYEGSLSLAGTGNKNQLFNRIKRIMEMKKQHINYSQVGIVVLAIIAISCSVAVFTPSFAQKSKPKKESTTVTTVKGPYYTEKTYTDSNGTGKVVTKTTTKIIRIGDDSDVHVSYNEGEYSNELEQVIRDIADASKDVAVAMSKIDRVKLDKDMDRAKKDIAKPKTDMDAIDWDEIRAEIKKGLAEADRQLSDPKLKMEISREVQNGLEEARAGLQEAKAELRKQKINIDISTDNEINPPTPPATNNYDDMLDKMQDEGLISRYKGFTIVKKNDKLVINGERQPDRVYDRYSNYLQARKMNISGSKGKLSISIDN